MIIRSARPDDVIAIASLLSHPAMRGHVLPRSKASIAASLDEWVIGIDERDGLVGCVALKEQRSDLAEIRSLAVSPLARGKGFAMALLRAAVACAWQQRYASVFAQTRAIALFERAGFRQMEDDAEHRPLCGRELRDGYHRVRIDPAPLSAAAVGPVGGPSFDSPEVAEDQERTPVGYRDADVDGASPMFAAHPDDMSPPGFHYHRYGPAAPPAPFAATI